MIAKREIARHKLMLGNFHNSSGKCEGYYRVADVNMRNTVLRITRLFARSTDTAVLHTACNGIGIVVVIQGMFNAIESNDRRLNRKRAGNYHAERGDRTSKSVGPQSEQTDDSFAIMSLTKVNSQGNAMTWAFFCLSPIAHAETQRAENPS